MTKSVPVKKTLPAVAAKSKAVVKPKVAAKPTPAAKSKPVAKPAVAKKTAVPASKATPLKTAVSAQKSAPALPVKAKPVVIEKVKKSKLVRDSFTMPEEEYAALSEVKKACLKVGIEVKKSELLRVGVAHIRKMDLAVLKQAISVLAPLKAGRPKKEK